MKEIYTIGYSTFIIESFLAVLRKYSINVVADVRSSPYSKYKPEFNKNELKHTLSNHNFSYVFLGDQCGARIKSPECYINGKADYNLISKHPLFIQGLDRIKTGIEKYRIVLMCAEKDPITCHRMILICKNLKAPEIQIYHILENTNLETQQNSEKRLLELYNLDQPHLFETENDQLNEAYERQASKIAYSQEIDIEKIIIK